MQLQGIHHLTAITAKARENHAFYTGLLGMRLVKKTVNQDDVSAYHLFYADGLATPGSDLTFFDWPTPRETRGADSISTTALRVAGEASLAQATTAALIATRQLAKRQLTWLRAEPAARWFDPDSPSARAALAAEVRAALAGAGGP